MKPTLILLVSSILWSEVALGQLTTYMLPWWHPTLQNVADEFIAAPPGHPLLDEDENFQGFIASYENKNHRFFDGEDGFLYAPDGLPNNHPGLDQYFVPGVTPYALFPIVYFNHPDVHEAYRQGKSIPQGHPLVMDLLSALLPTNHPDIDGLFQQQQVLPIWHIDISMIVNIDALPIGIPKIDVPHNHPNVDENFKNGIPQPEDHPSIEVMLLDYLPPNHPQNLDEMIHNPRNFSLPFGHPSLNSMLLRGSAFPTARPTSIVTDAAETESSIVEDEVNIDGNQTIAEDDLLENVEVNNDDNQTTTWLDLLADLSINIEDNETIADEEGLLEDVEVVIEGNQTMESENLFEDVEVNIESNQTIAEEDLPEEVEIYIEGNQTIAEEDLLVDEEANIEVIEDPFLEEDAFNIEDPFLEEDAFIIEDPFLEEDAFNIEGNVLEEDEFIHEDNQPITEEDLVGEGAAYIEDNQLAGSSTAQAKDTVELTSIEVLPTDIPFSVYSGHRALAKEMIVPPFKHHPTVYHLFMVHQPPDHPNIDDLIEEGFTLPRWHPSIGHMIAPRVLTFSPGSLLCYALSALFVVALVSRNCKHWYNSRHHSNEKCIPGKGDENFIIDDTRMSSSDVSSNSDDGRSVLPSTTPGLSHEDGYDFDPLFLSLIADVNTLPKLDQKHHNAMTISRIQNESDAEPVQSSIIAYSEKRNSRLRSAWIKSFGKRAFGTHSSNGDLVFCLFYLVLNSLALLLSPYDLNVGFGSLAAGNIVFLVASAIKNSVFTWFLGMAFDQIIVYHQFIGRVTVLASFVHSCFYFNRLLEFMSDRVYKTGFIALMFGIFITISSLNWIRRKYFNVFYWSHIAFVGFIVCVYMHARGARPFILASVASYTIDKILHMVWTQLPRKTVCIEPVGEGGKTTFVRISKTPLNRLLGRNTVGQWVVVNFPELSLTEWHPFSVASGPSQPFIDLYIRALGNHTKRIAKYSEKCASENRQALIRVDGPYGNLSFNYRRYGSLVLVGGGIGITPIISIMKDIYEKGEAKQPKKSPHCIKNVHLIWIMPFEADATLFLDQLLIYRELSTHEPSLPLLQVSIHVTREESVNKVESRPIFYSRPDFTQMMNECTAKAVEASSSSILIFACGPGSMVNQVWDVSMKKNSNHIRVDFHHESFAY